MKEFKTVKYDKESEIILKNSTDLNELYKLIEDGDNFIILYKEESKEKAQIIIGTNLFEKIRNGTFELKSEQEILK